MLFFHTRKNLFLCELFRTGKNRLSSIRSVPHSSVSIQSRNWVICSLPINGVPCCGTIISISMLRTIFTQETNHLVIAHIALMKAFHFWDMRGKVFQWLGGIIQPWTRPYHLKIKFWQSDHKTGNSPPNAENAPAPPQYGDWPRGMIWP